MTFPWLVLGVLGTAALAALAARFTRQYLVAAVAGSGVIMFLHSRLYFRYTGDDSYISYRYARNLSDGLGLVWNPGEHVEGYSNYLWVVLLAGVHRAGGDIVFTGRWLGFALGIVAAAGAYLLARTLVEGQAGRWAGLAAALLLAASGPFALWSTAGLETSLFAVLMLAAVLLHIRESQGLRPPLSGAVWALVSLTRPDGPLLFAVSALFKIGEYIAHLREMRSYGALRRARLTAGATMWLLVWAALFLAIWGPYFIWREGAYGYLFPNTYYAKVGSGLDQYDRGLRYLAQFMREYAAWLLLLAPLAAALTRIRRVAVLYGTALVVAWFGYIAYVGGDSLVRFRFLAPVLPLFYALVAASGAALIAGVRLERPVRRWVAEGSIAVAFIGLMLFTLHSSATDTLLKNERQAVADRAEIGRWLRANVPEDTSIAVIPAGAIPFESGLTTIDMLGISDEHIAHRDLSLGDFAAGHEKYDSEYVLDREPDIIILEDTLTPDPRAREAYEILRGGVIPARIDMLSTPRLWDEYEARSVEIEEGSWFNLLVRNGATAVLGKTQSPLPLP